MGLKGKLAALAAKEIEKKVISNGTTADDAINSFFAKMGKAAGQKTAIEYAQQSPKNCLIVKTRSYSLGTMAEVLKGKVPNTGDCLDKYQFFDVLGAIKYRSIAEGTSITQEILDATGHRIGRIEEHPFIIGVPLLEKEVRGCSVYIGKEKIAKLKKCVSFGEVQFETFEGNVEIMHKEGEPLKICYNKKVVAALHNVPLSLKDEYVEKYVMEYDDISNEIVAVVLAIAIDSINE